MPSLKSVHAAALIMARSGAFSSAEFPGLIASLGDIGRASAALSPRKLRAIRRELRAPAPAPEPVVEMVVEADPIIQPDETHPSDPSKMSEADIRSTFVEGGIKCLLGKEGHPVEQVVKDLGRHLRKHFGVSATEYRERFGLPETYPMTLEGVSKYLASKEG